MSRRMLIVDDEETIRWALRELFMQEGWVVDAAGDGDQAAEKVAKGRYNFMITDLKMPGRSGVEVIRRARHANPGLGVLVLTGYASLETAVEALRLRAWDYITKPCRVAHLKQRVDEFFAQQDTPERQSTELTAADIEHFAAGGGIELLSVQSDGCNADALVEGLAAVIEDVGMQGQRGTALTQVCVEAMSAASGECIVRCGLLRGKLLVVVSVPRTQTEAPGPVVERVGARLGVATCCQALNGNWAIAVAEAI